MQWVLSGHFRAHETGIDSGLVAVDDVLMESVFYVRRAILGVEEARKVCFVFREEQIGAAGAEQPALAILPVLQLDATAPRNAGSISRHGTTQVLAPRPGIAKPELRQDVQLAGFRAAIHGCNANEDVFDVRLGVFDDEIEVAIVRKYASVEQFEFWLAAATAAILIDQRLVRELGLRILVQHAHVAVRGSGVQVKVAFLHVFTVIALIPCKTEQAFLEDGIAAVPKRQAETHKLVSVTDPADAI